MTTPNRNELFNQEQERVVQAGTAIAARLDTLRQHDGGLGQYPVVPAAHSAVDVFFTQPIDAVGINMDVVNFATPAQQIKDTASTLGTFSGSNVHSLDIVSPRQL